MVLVVVVLAVFQWPEGSSLPSVMVLPGRGVPVALRSNSPKG